MNLKESLLREILEEVMEQGVEAFRSVLEKLLKYPYERTSRRRDQANGFKDKTVATRVGRLEAEDRPGKALVILPEVVGARRPLGEGLKAGHYRDGRQASLHSQGEPRSRSNGVGPRSRPARSPRIAPLLDRELEQFREREFGAYRVVPSYEKVRVNSMVRDLGILKAIGVNGWGKWEVLASDDHCGSAGCPACRVAFGSLAAVPVPLGPRMLRPMSTIGKQARERGQAIRDIFNSPSLADVEGSSG